LLLVIFNLSAIGKGNDILIAYTTIYFYMTFFNDSCSVRAHNWATYIGHSCNAK